MLEVVVRRTEGEPVFDAARAPSGAELAGLLKQKVARLMKLLTRETLERNLGEKPGVRSCLLLPRQSLTPLPSPCASSSPVRSTTSFPVEDHSDHAALAQYSMSVDSMQRVDAQVLDYCLMDNHDHFVLHTHRANRSRLMRRLNRVHTQAFNRRHRNVGHLFQGRFKAILVERDAYLWRCAVMWNSTRYAHKVIGPGEWPWSSYRAHVGEAHPPPWLDMGGLHGYLL